MHCACTCILILYVCVHICIAHVQWQYHYTSGIHRLVGSGRSSGKLIPIEMLFVSPQDEYEAILGCIEDALDLPNQPSE